MKVEVGALTGVGLTVAVWCGFMVALGLLAKATVWLFCLGYGC